MFGIVFWKVHYLFCIFNRIHTEVFISEGPVKSVNESMKADIRIMAHCVLFVTGAPIKGLSTEKYWGETWFLSWLHSLWVLNQGSSNPHSHESCNDGDNEGEGDDDNDIKWEDPRITGGWVAPDLKFVATTATGVHVKFLVSCVFFSRIQRSFSHNLQVYTHLNVNFIHNCYKIYTFVQF